MNERLIMTFVYSKIPNLIFRCLQSDYSTIIAGFLPNTLHIFSLLPSSNSNVCIWVSPIGDLGSCHLQKHLKMFCKTFYKKFYTENLPQNSFFTLARIFYLTLWLHFFKAYELFTIYILWIYIYFMCINHTLIND